MLSNTFVALSFASIAFTSFGCAAVHATAAPATPAVVVEQTSSSAAVAGYVSPVESASEAAPAPAIESAPVPEMRGIHTIFGGNGADQGASQPEPILRGDHRSGAPAAPGAFAPDVVQRIAGQGLGQAQRCYEDGRKRDPHLAGRMDVVLTVGATGKVWRVKAKDTEIRDPHVISCVESSFYMLSFPAQEQSVTEVTYPIVFGERS